MKVEPLLLDQTDFIVLILDSVGRFISLNPAAERLFHMSQDELVGRPFHTILDDYSFSKAEQMLELTLKNGGVKGGKEFVLVRNRVIVAEMPK